MIDKVRLQELTTETTTPELINMFYELAKIFGSKYQVNDDMVQDAVIACWQVVGKFNPSRSSAYTFFGLIVRHSFCQSLRKEARWKEVVLGYDDNWQNRTNHRPQQTTCVYTE